ncbi:putative uncharacterized protein [Lacticaseibacillus paracasei NRIC 1917]|nr:putative uncharacterized protein [Lacticaseibacillus paracasei NRIC 1917]
MNEFATKAIRNVNGGNTMEYRIQLNTRDQLFIAIDVNNQNHYGTGRTIEQAVSQLKVTNTAT